MTALAGGLPRMMRPSPHQNYPRGGYSLEGKHTQTTRFTKVEQTSEKWQSSTVKLQLDKADKLKLFVRRFLLVGLI